MKNNKELMFILKAIPTAITIIAIAVAFKNGALMGNYGLAICILGAVAIMAQIVQMAKLTKKIAPQYIDNNKRKS